jgi:hypothetical protein
MAALVAAIFVALGACDAAIALARWMGALPDAARWPAMHAAGNAVVCVLALPGVVATLSDPLHAMDSRVYPPTHAAASPSPSCAIAAIHLYHAAFFTLARADLFHHILFVVPSMCFIVCAGWGVLPQLLAFFICGLPGLMDYVSICLYYTGAISRATRRRVTASINLWLRAPGLLFVATLHYVAFAHGTTSVPLAMNVVSGTLVAFNAMYYTASSVRSAAGA